MKALLFVAGAAVVGNFLAERFVLKSTAEDPTGFILVADGFGLDDAARAIVIGATYMLAKKFLPGMGS